MIDRSSAWLGRVLVLAAGLSPGQVAGQAVAPDLPALIQCRAESTAWGVLAISFMDDPGRPAALGWVALEWQNPFLQEYDLPSDIRVFGHDTGRIALTASGVMGVLGGVDAAELGASLGVTAVPAGPGQYLGEKLVLEKTTESDGFKLRTRVSINVSTIDTHPGKTLAGCSYVVDILDE